MSVYPEKIAKKLSEKAAAAASEGAVCGRAASFICGCFAEACISVDDDAQVIANIGFATNGCGYMTASGIVLEEKLTGRELAALKGLSDDRLVAELESDLGEFPDQRKQCALVAIEALRAAFGRLRKARAAEFVGDSPLVCTCFGVSEDDLLAAIRMTQASQFRDLEAATRAGRGCGACRMLIEELIETAKIRD